MTALRVRLTTKTRLRRAVVLLAAVSVLTMPVSYTGGRDVSHPHAFVQLFFDAARGSTSHHRDMDGHAHPEPLPREFFLVDVPDDTPVVTQTGGSSERVALVSMALAAGLFLLFRSTADIGTFRHRLFGLTVGPEIPPPRSLAMP